MNDTVIICPHCGYITNVESFEIEIKHNCPACRKNRFKDFNIVTENGEPDKMENNIHDANSVSIFKDGKNTYE